jgi:N-acetylglucosamine-6-sulfatase
MERNKISRSRKLATAPVVGVVVVALAIGCGSGVGPKPQPGSHAANVLVLMTDDQTNADLRVMPKTRRLLEARGMAFTRFYASYPLCCPSRTTFLTGQYAHNTGVQGNFPDTDGGGYLNLRDPGRTLPVWLGSAGLDTAVVGKWPEFPPPGVPPGWTDWWTTTESTIAHYYDYSLNWTGGGIRSFGSDASDYNTTVLTRLAERLVERSARRHNRFFVWVSYTAPHFGFGRDDAASRRCGGVPEPGRPAGQTAVPAPADASTFDHASLPRSPSFDEANVRDKPPFLRRRRLDHADLREIRTDYGCRLASLLAVDRSVATLVGALRRTGELDRTLILFTSDNGFLLGQHREAAGKNLPYEEAIRVPLLMRGPGIPGGGSVSTPVANVDLAPTILDAAGASEPSSERRPVDGRSLLPLVTGDRDPDRAVLIEGRDDAAPRGPSGAFESLSYDGVRTSRYLYVEWHRAVRSSSAAAAATPLGAGPVVGMELYDTERDPYELINRVGAGAYRPARRKLAAVLARLQTCAGSRCLESVSIPAPIGSDGFSTG